MYIQMAEREDTLGYDCDTEYRLKLLSAELLDAAQNHKWSEAEVLQLDVAELTAHVKETLTRVDEAMNILKESNLCLNMSEKARDWKSCASWEAIYIACRQILHDHLEYLKKEIQDGEEREQSLSKTRKATPSCSQEGRNLGQKRRSKETADRQPILLSPVTLDSTIDSEDDVLVDTEEMGKCHSPKC
jgi:hypothetical protein